MKRLLLLCILALSSLTASANQIGLFFRDAPSLDQNLPNLAPVNDAYYSVAGNAHGTSSSYVNLTYNFTQPLERVEFGFRLSGGTNTGLSGTATASYYDEINKFFNGDDEIHYFVVYVEDRDLRKVDFVTFGDTRLGYNLDPSDDFLDIVSIRAVTRDEAPVPEPGTAMLFAVAFVGMFGVGRFARRK